MYNDGCGDTSAIRFRQETGGQRLALRASRAGLEALQGIPESAPPWLKKLNKYNREREQELHPVQRAIGRRFDV